MPETTDLATETLRALLRVPGALKIVTAEVHPDLRAKRSDPRSPIRPSVLRDDPDALKRTATMVCHDVTDLSGPDERGNLTARSAEGDWCYGDPEALLRRLTEWRAG